MLQQQQTAAAACSNVCVDIIITRNYVKMANDIKLTAPIGITRVMLPDSTRRRSSWQNAERSDNATDMAAAEQRRRLQAKVGAQQGSLTRWAGHCHCQAGPK